MDDQEAAAEQPAAAQTPPAAESAETEATSPDPRSPDPRSPDPQSPDPQSTDPQSTDPQSTDPQSTDGTRKRRSFLRELPFLIGTALVLALLLKIFIVQTFYIPSSSMEDTLHIDDRVLVNKVVYHLRDIKRGEVVVFNGADSFDESQRTPKPGGLVTSSFAGVARFFGAQGGERDYIKRVIGLPGDHVKCCDEQGRITVNGVALDEGAYLYPGDKPSLETFDIVVPEGRLWVMGDHRTVSQDSRSHLGEPGGGTVPINKVIGKAFVVIWPFAHWQSLPIPDTFKQPAIDANAGRG